MRRADAPLTLVAECASKGAQDLTVKEILVCEGELVEAGRILMVIEYYKIITEVIAPVTGVVEKVYVAAGAEVQVGDKLLDLRPRLAAA